MTTAALTPHAQHALKVYQAPTTKGALPLLLRELEKRLIKLLSKGKIYHTKTQAGGDISVRLVTHARNGKERQVRKERRHSIEQVIRLLISKCNVRPLHSKFTFLEISKTAIDDIVQETGFARSTVNAVIAELKNIGALRTKRQKNPDKTRERIARRWLTAALFDAVGLSKWLKQQKEGTERQIQTTYINTDQAQPTATEAEGRAAFRKMAEGLRGGPPGTGQPGGEG